MVAVLATVAASLSIAGVIASRVVDDASAAQLAAHDFKIDCSYSHSAKDDPIVFPGQPGASHMHDFYGNASTNAYSTYASMKGVTSTCVHNDRAAYWTPTLYRNGQMVHSDGVIVYYTLTAYKATHVEAFPPNFKMIVGNKNDTTAAEVSSHIYWGCEDDSQISYTRRVPPASCPKSDGIMLRVEFPSCWDGVTVPGDEAADHMRYPSGGNCPKGYPHVFPRIGFHVTYQFHSPTTGNITFSSGVIYSEHMDFLNTWDQPTLQTLVDDCMNAQDTSKCGHFQGRAKGSPGLPVPPVDTSGNPPPTTTPTGTGTPAPTGTPTPTPTMTSTPPSTGTGPTVTRALTIPATLGTHDPSRIINDGGSYYFYSTGGDLPGWYTTDGKNWRRTPSVLTHGIPASVHSAVPANDGHDVWAPDVIYNPYTRLFGIYYSVAKWGVLTQSAIGLVTSPTLNPRAADYQWTDRGIVFAQVPGVRYTAIDPAPFFDADGNMWMAFGSGHSSSDNARGVSIIALDRTTGVASTNDKTVYTQEECGCEAPYLAHHGGYYYLFWNTGGCCNGAASSYTIHVARSTSVTGPYTERATHFRSSTATEHGPGQLGILNQDGTDYYTYHYYPNNGGSVLGIGTLTWGADGWPTD